MARVPSSAPGAPPPSERRVTGRCSAPALSQLHSNWSRARATAARPPGAARAAPRRRPFPGPDGPRPRRPDGPRGCRGRGAQAAACPRGGLPSVGGAAGVGAGARGAVPARTASGLPSAPWATPLPHLGSTGSRALSPHFVRNLTRHPPFPVPRWHRLILCCLILRCAAGVMEASIY